MVLGGGAALAWFLWAGWRLQAAAAGVPARLEAWVWGFLDALALGAGPLGLLAGWRSWAWAPWAPPGFRGRAGLHWIGASLVRLASSALSCTWWLFRLARAGGPAAWAWDPGGAGGPLGPGLPPVLGPSLAMG